MRITEILTNAGWRLVEFKNIKAGDMFRLFESSGDPVIGPDGKNEFVAKSYPYVTNDGVWGIDILDGGGDTEGSEKSKGNKSNTD